MARIVPARPIMSNEISQRAITELELILDDTYIIFQNFPVQDFLFVCANGQKMFVVAPMHEAKRIDYDLSSFVTPTNNFISFIDTARDIKTALELAKLPPLIPIFYYSPKFKAENTFIPSNGHRADIRFYKTTDQIVQKVGFLEQGEIADDITIDAVINHVTPGGLSYEPGNITESQLEWRRSQPKRDLDALIEELRTEIAAPVTKKNRLDNVKLKAGEGKVNALDLEDDIGEAPKRDAEYVAPSIQTPKQLSVAPKRPVVTYENDSQRIKYMENMVAKCLSNIAREKSIYSSGVEVDPSFIASSNSLLPAVLIAASEHWTPVVANKKGKGGFDIRLETDKSSLLGFKVSDVMPSAPLVLLMPISHLFKKMINKDELLVDEIVSIFARWVEKYNLDTSELEEIDLKIALKAIEG